jgi:hypothetical protein
MKASLLIAMALALLLCLSPPTQAQVPDSLRFVGTTSLNGHLCHILNVWQEGELDESHYYYEENGYVRFYALQDSGGPIEMLDEDNYYIVKQAPQVGDTWLIFMEGTPNGYPADAEVISSEMITVPAGSFQTFVVECRDTVTSELVFTYYWSSSVSLGIVAMGGNWGLGELTDYDLVGGLGCFPLAVGNWWTYDLTTGVKTEPQSSPSSFLLLQAYPNPFNPTAALSYQLPTHSFVNLEAYDIAGKLISTLANGWQAAGTHRAIFDGSVLPSGIYIYRLTAGNFSATGKMLLLK